MRMDGQDESQNVEDVRDAGGGGGGFGFGGRSIGIGTVVVALVAGWIFGVNPLTVLGLLSGGAPTTQTQPPGAGAQAAGRRPAGALRFAGAAQHRGRLDRRLPARPARPTSPPKLVLFRGATPTACGQGQAAMGPFYCPGDQKVYLDLELLRHCCARGSARRATSPRPTSSRTRSATTCRTCSASPTRSTRAPARCAGAGERAVACASSCRPTASPASGPSARKARCGWRLEPGDVETALNAASQIGDDTLQRQRAGTVVPETFTHGTSAQRVGWFKRGFDSARSTSATPSTRVSSERSRRPLRRARQRSKRMPCASGSRSP